MIDLCPTACNANMASNVLANFNLTDTTRVMDTTCNGVMLLTDDPGNGFLSTEKRTRVVGSFAEVSSRFLANSPTYRALAEFFANVGQRGVTGQIMLGYWDEAADETIIEALDEINECSGCWTHFAVVHYDQTGTTMLMDSAAMLLAGSWAQANERIGYFLSVDPSNSDSTSTTTLRAQLQAAGALDQFVVVNFAGQCAQKFTYVAANGANPAAFVPQYFASGEAVTDFRGDPVLDDAGVQVVSDGTVPEMEPYHGHSELLTAGWIAGVDLSQSNSGYDIANKPLGGLGWIGIEPSVMTNGDLTVVTGRNLDGTLNPTTLGFANAYVRNENQNGMQFGLTVGGFWIDQVHLRIYLRRQIKDALTRLFVNSRRIPYDDARGAQMLANAVSSVMAAAQSAGHFTGDAIRWEDYGFYLRKGIGWVIRQDSFAAQSPARKHARIAPQLSVCYVPAGATNFVPVTLCTLAVPQPGSSL